MSRSDACALASLPASWLDAARMSREHILFDRQVARLLAAREVERGVPLRDPALAAARFAAHCRSHAESLAAAVAARRAASRLGVARLPG